METKKFNQIQSSVDLQFFCEELYNKTYNKDRQTFISDLMNLIHSYADDVAKLVAEEVRKETLMTVEENVKKAFNSVQEENVLNKLSEIMKSDEDDEDEEYDNIFSLDK